jgi:putative transposase
MPRGALRGVDDLELATLSWRAWFNQTRLHSSIGNVPPIEYEAAHYATQATPESRCVTTS